MAKDIKYNKDELNKLRNELAQVENSIKELQTGIFDNNKTEEIKSMIRQYLREISNVMVKIIKLSQNLLYIKDGRILFNGQLTPFNFTYANALDVTKEQIQRINYCIKYMATNGVSPRYLAELGKSLITLYAIYDSDSALSTAYRQEEMQNRQKRIIELTDRKEELVELIKKVQEVLDASLVEYETQKAAFNSTNLTIANALNEEIRLPILINDQDKVLKFWELNKGLLFIKTEKKEYKQTIDFLKSLIIKFLYSYPKVESNILYCCDELINEINIFLMNVEKKLDPSIFFNSIRYACKTNKTKIDSTLNELKELYEHRTSLLSDSNVSTILEYNRMNEDNIQKPILVILQNYPYGYENEDNLAYLLSNGSIFGVFFVVIQTKDKLNRNEYSDEMLIDPKEYSGLELECRNGNFYSNDVYLEYTKYDNSQIDEALLPLNKIRKASKEIITYESLGFPDLNCDEEVENVISIPVGKVENQIYNIEFAVAGKEDKPIAYLLVGIPKSGKSSLIDSMIFNGCMKYSPDDLTFYLIDFKDGVSSAMYINKAKMPHIKVVAQNSKQEEAEIILNTLVKEQKRRNEEFVKLNVKTLAAYNKLSKKHMPRIVVVIDEASIMFEEDETAQGRTELLISLCSTIARQGRSAGIHLVLASQSVENKMKPITKFIPGRFCFNAEYEDAESTVGREHAKKVSLECKQPGVALGSHDSGTTVRKMKFAYHNDNEADYAAKVREKWSNYPIDTVVVGDDSKLFFDDVAKEKDLYPESIAGAAIGESFYNHAITYLPFDESHHTLVMVGENNEIQTHHLMSIMIYALKQKGKILLLDDSQDLVLDSMFRNNYNVKSFDGKEYLEMLKTAYKEYDKRNENRRETYEPYFVIINNLHTISAFEENRKYKEKKESNNDFSSSGGYMDIRRMREQADTDSFDKEILGADTFMELLNKAGRVRNFFVIFSIDKSESVRRYQSTIANCDYKILSYPFVPTMSGIADRLYNQKLGQSCSERISLLSSKQEAFEKIRYYNYEDNLNTRNYINKEISK